jgi:hypothetical protein
VAFNPYELDERWEYEMFTEVLTSARYPVKKNYALIHSLDQLSMGKVQDYDRHLVKLIEKAAQNLLRRAGDQGWEPVDAIDAESLWAKGRIHFGEVTDSEGRIEGSQIVELTTVHIFCRRRIQIRWKAVVELSTESNPALKHLEPDEDMLLA